MSEENRFVGPDDVETLRFDWGTLKWQSTPDVTNAREFSTGVVQLNPGKGHERHRHPESEEILYVISGNGVQTVADEEREIAAGDLVHIPADVEHSTINTGWETMKLLAVYGPPGPEDVLRDMPECEILPPGELLDV
jgi:oxalate decarboxylase/phosphoglucose isomerase-like protein (cupin superfamily)